METQEHVVIVGAGGHGRSLTDVVASADGFVVAGFVDNLLEKGTKVLGYPVLGSDEKIPELVASGKSFLIGVGQIKSPEKRVSLYRLIQESGGRLPTVVSPHAYVSPHATLGAGTVVFHGAVVNANATIGDNCIINSLALVEHDVTVGNHCHISTGSRVNGEVVIGQGSFVGSGAIVLETAVLPDYTIVPAGARWDSRSRE